MHARFPVTAIMILTLADVRTSNKRVFLTLFMTNITTNVLHGNCPNVICRLPSVLQRMDFTFKCKHHPGMTEWKQVQVRGEKEDLRLTRVLNFSCAWSSLTNMIPSESFVTGRAVHFILIL